MPNVLQISEGTNSVGFSGGICAFAYVLLSAAFLSNELLTIKQIKKMITKGKFKDGTIGWKVDNRETNGVKCFEIHWSDDGECVTDYVYERSDADLIAAAPELLIACENALRDIHKLNTQLIAEGKHGYILMENELNNAINKAYGDVVR